MLIIFKTQTLTFMLLVYCVQCTVYSVQCTVLEVHVLRYRIRSFPNLRWRKNAIFLSHEICYHWQKNKKLKLGRFRGLLYSVQPWSVKRSKIQIWSTFIRLSINKSYFNYILIHFLGTFNQQVGQGFIVHI